jgi:dipeptidyl-peptidase-4
MRKSIVLLLFICSVASSNAQKKELTGDQYFKNNFKGIISPLPSITKWLDNTHFVMNKDSKTWVVDATNGNQREATDQEKGSSSTLSKPTAFMKGADLFIKIENKEIQLTNDSAKELNPTMSPDGNSVAYTKNNDLYVIEISTQKETRLTFDGSDVILNGYASWVYMEEILGRASQYRSFWWSPDSKRIAFFRSDDSKVPTYTITDAPGQHGYVDVIRYPKVGDPNPEVKVGVVSSNGGNIVWADFNEHDDQYFGLPYWKTDGKSLLVQWMNRKQNQLKILIFNVIKNAQ